MTFTSWGCAAVVQRTVREWLTVRQGRTRAPERSAGTNTGADGQSARTTDHLVNDEQLGCKNVGDDSWGIQAPNWVRFVSMAF